MPSPRMLEFSDRIRAARAAAPDTGDVAEGRARMEAEMAKLALPEDLARETIAIGERSARWHRVPGLRSDGALLYLHGGGYVRGSLDTHAELMGRLARTTAMPILGLDYRLAPEHPYPAAVEDAVAAYRWLLDAGFPPRTIVIGGDSAGGGLAVALLLALKDADLEQPAGAVLFSPWTDLSGSGASVRSRAEADPMVNAGALGAMAAQYLGTTPATTPGASPLFGDLAGLPPLLIQVGDAEILLDDATRLDERARAAGVDTTLRVFADGFHVFQAVPAIPEAGEALADAAAFCRRVTAD